MDLIVMDLEWNQSSTGQEPEIAKMPFEIIEIGALRLNENFDMVGEFSELVKPVVYPKLYHITSKLIHLQMKELQRGEEFTKVGARFLEWCGDDYRICTWGPTDITELQRNLNFFEMNLVNDGPVAFIDVQKIFAMAYEQDEKVRRNLEYAVDMLDIEKDIPFHRAFSDAYYTAKVLARIAKEHPDVLKYFSFDVTFPPKTKEDEIFVDFGTYTKTIYRSFAKKEDILKNRSIMAVTCNICNKNIKRRIKWFSSNGKQYIAAGYCDKHGLIKNRVKIQKCEQHQICAIKIVKPIENEGLLKLQEKSARADELRRKRKEAEKRAKAQNGGK